jgi:hypothetical protein
LEIDNQQGADGAGVDKFADMLYRVMTEESLMSNDPEYLAKLYERAQLANKLFSSLIFKDAVREAMFKMNYSIVPNHILQSVAGALEYYSAQDGGHEAYCALADLKPYTENKCKQEP